MFLQLEPLFYEKNVYEESLVLKLTFKNLYNIFCTSDDRIRLIVKATIQLQNSESKPIQVFYNKCLMIT